MALNIRNHGIVVGRLTKDVRIFENKGGSKKVMVTVAVQNNYTNRDGQRDAQFVNLEAFIPATAKGNGPYDYMHKGDLVGFQFTVRSNHYVKDGVDVYEQVLHIESVDLMETKKAQEARRNGSAASDEAPAEQTVSEDDNPLDL